MQNKGIDELKKPDRFEGMRPGTQTVSRLDYRQYLLVSEINYTLTNFAETEKSLVMMPSTAIWWETNSAPS